MTFSTPWRLRLIALAALALGLVPAANAQVTILEEDFEDETVVYTTSVDEFSDSSSDFFTRTDGSTISSNYEVTGFGGTSYFAAQDIDGEVDSATQSMFFSDIDVEGLTDLQVSFKLAEDDSNDGNEDWDAAEHFRVYASVYDVSVAGRQRGGEVLIFAVESDPGTGDVIDATNTEPRVDTDFDELGDGAAITPEFAAFMASIPGTGERLDLRIEFSLNAGDEDIAIDDVVVTGTAEVVEPEPLACAVGTGLSFVDRSTFNTDSDPEVIPFTNLSDSPVDVTGCQFVAFDPLTEQVTSSFALTPRVVSPGADDVFTGISGLDIIPDGPGAVVLVEGSVAVGATVADVLPQLVTGMVYQSETEVLHIYSSFAATATSSDEFLAAIASLAGSVANEDEANGIDLAVTAAPNPLRDRTTVAFGVADAADVRVAVYDALGREVALLAEAPYSAGRHEVTFEANDLPAGVYVVRAVVGADARAARVTIAR
ncbi:MAG: hypothetical protein Rubg2KO_35480 [Rubricoccaceae bacterium]